jgi:formylglycine-generating enzyme required for sulfatase activity
MRVSPLLTLCLAVACTSENADYMGGSAGDGGSDAAAASDQGVRLDVGPVPDQGARLDVGVPADQGVRPDQGISPDLGLDQGVSVDQGVRLDQGVAPDLGVTLDQGVAPDQGVRLDQGVAPDLGVTLDQGVSLDQGVAVDEGVRLDRGVAPDLGVTLDQGIAPDQGVRLDQGVAADVGVTPDSGPDQGVAPDQGPACRAPFDCADPACAADLRCRVPVEWVHIPGGQFQMGLQEGDADERPVHAVNVPAFDLARSEVTVAQYDACVQAGACSAPHWDDGVCHISVGEHPGPGRLPDAMRGPTQPVVCVTWEQAGAFAAWVGGRLPTEAEWEFAARNGRAEVYPWGNHAADCTRAVITFNGTGCGQSRTDAVCARPAGDDVWGVCDLTGNAQEWVEDWYHATYDGAPADGSAWVDPPGETRITRGASWVNGRDLRATNRRPAPPDRATDTNGIRVAR